MTMSAIGREEGVDTTVESAISVAEYKRVLGGFCTGVTVVASVVGGTPVGFTCQSFGALSLSPPLVMLCPAASSTTWPLIRAAGAAVISILAADQEDLSRRFAVSGGDKFADVRWEPSPSGLPILDGALGWVDCEIEDEHPAGDHTIAVCRVRALSVNPQVGPLLFHHGRYVRTGDPRGEPAAGRG